MQHAIAVLYDMRQIESAVRRVADDLRPCLAAENACLLVVLEGARRFAEDLVARIGRPCDVYQARARSYDGTSSSGQVRVDGLDSLNLTGRSVVIVDDVFDTGRTLAAALRRRGARAT